MNVLSRSSKRRIANALSSSHVALFLSRAESGTDLSAQEAISIGVPSIISWNTGHKDLVEAAIAAVAVTA